MTAFEASKFEQVVRKIDTGSRLLRAWALDGGVSAQVTALEVELPDDSPKKMIVRRHGPADLAHNPNIATDEFKLLQIVQAAGVPVPTPYYLDRSCDIFSTPYIVLEYIEGAAEFAPANLHDFIRQFAAQLARIHLIGSSKADLSFLPKAKQVYSQRVQTRPAHLDAAFEEGRIRDILEGVWPPPQRNPPVLLHGDYWPGNIIWRDNRIAAVIDWEDAKVGDPLADLAGSRLEILWAFGPDAMHRFTQEYTALNGIDCTYLPYWDLCVTLHPMTKVAEWASNPDAEQSMRDRLRTFITEALGRIAGG